MSTDTAKYRYKNSKYSTGPGLKKTLKTVKYTYFDKMATVVRPIGQAIIFSSCGFYLVFSFFLLFSSPILSGRRLDVYHTSTYDVPLVRI